MRVEIVHTPATLFEIDIETGEIWLDFVPIGTATTEAKARFSSPEYVAFAKPITEHHRAFYNEMLRKERRTA